MDVKENFAIIGGIIGIAAFLWKVLEALTSHVSTQVSATNTQDSTCRIKVQITNSGLTPKRVAFACVVIFPFGKTLDEAVNSCLQSSGAASTAPSEALLALFQKSNSIAAPNGTSHCAVIPLPFIYKDQIQIGNETVTYEFPITLPSKDKGKFFEVRVIIYSIHFFGHYVRWRQSSTIATY